LKTPKGRELWSIVRDQACLHEPSPNLHCLWVWRTGDFENSGDRQKRLSAHKKIFEDVGYGLLPVSCSKVLLQLLSSTDTSQTMLGSSPRFWGVL